MTSSILFNTSFHLHPSLADDFLEWVNNTYMPAAKASNLFEESMVARILAAGVQAENDGVSYCVQFVTRNLTKAMEWHDSEAYQLKEAFSRRCGKCNIVFFTTYMEILSRQ